MSTIFPINKNINQVYTNESGQSWKWNGHAWQNLGMPSKTFATDSSISFKKVIEKMYKESPEEIIDGENTVFSIKKLPIPGSEHLFVNGVLQKHGEDYDYLMTNNVINMNYPVPMYSVITCTYTYIKSTEIINENPLRKTDGITFELNYPVDVENEYVFLNGVLQQQGLEGDYTIDGNFIIFNFEVPESSIVTCTYFTSF